MSRMRWSTMRRDGKSAVWAPRCWPWSMWTTWTTLPVSLFVADDTQPAVLGRNDRVFIEQNQGNRLLPFITHYRVLTVKPKQTQMIRPCPQRNSYPRTNSRLSWRNMWRRRNLNQDFWNIPMKHNDDELFKPMFIKIHTLISDSWFLPLIKRVFVFYVWTCHSWYAIYVHCDW